MFERELWEQTGLDARRATPGSSRCASKARASSAWTSTRSSRCAAQEVHEVGVGPIHASVIEPGHFRFMCHGEQVHHLEIQLGYQHRGVEALLLQRPPLALTPLVESIAGDTSIAYAWGHCAALEALAGVPVAPGVERVRGVALELERIAMHLVGARPAWPPTSPSCRAAPPTAGCAPPSSTPRMRVCGSRFGRGWLRPGGVRHRASTRARGRTCSTRWRPSPRDFAEVNELMLGARSVRSRFQRRRHASAAARRASWAWWAWSRAPAAWPATPRAQLPGRAVQRRTRCRC